MNKWVNKIVKIGAVAVVLFSYLNLFLRTGNWGLMAIILGVIIIALSGHWAITNYIGFRRFRKSLGFSPAKNYEFEGRVCQILGVGCLLACIDLGQQDMLLHQILITGIGSTSIIFAEYDKKMREEAGKGIFKAIAKFFERR